MKYWEKKRPQKINIVSINHRKVSSSLKCLSPRKGDEAEKNIWRNNGWNLLIFDKNYKTIGPRILMNSTEET